METHIHVYTLKFYLKNFFDCRVEKASLFSIGNNHITI